MATNETGLVREIVRAVKGEWPDAWCFKVHGSPSQTIGTPDLLISVRGVLVAAEVKHRKPGESADHARGRATAPQLAQIRALQKSGAVAEVVLSAEETLELIRFALRRV